VQEVVQLITPSVPKKLSAFLFLFVPKWLFGRNIKSHIFLQCS
jgi:hypothetical protein